MVNRIAVALMPLLIGFLMLAGRVEAQESSEPSETQETGQPAQPKPSEQSRPSSLSFADDVVSSTRNIIGLSFSAMGGYSSSLFNSNAYIKPVSYSSYGAGVYFNAGRKRTRFHLRYGATYTIYNGRARFGSENAGSGSTDYSFKLTRRVTLAVSDTFSSSVLDNSILQNPAAFVLGSQPGNFQELALARQRVTRNSLNGSLNYQVTRKNRVAFFATHTIHRFGIASTNDTDGVSVGASWSYQLKKWLALENAYSAYLNQVDTNQASSRIHSVRVGQFTFRLSPATQAFVSGGMQLAQSSGGMYGSAYSGRLYQTATAQAGITRESRFTMLSLTYSRGFTDAIGSSSYLRESTLMLSDNATANIARRLTRFIDFRATASGSRGSYVIQSGSVDSVSAGAGLDFRLRWNLVASLSYYYVDQLLRGNLSGYPGVTRHSAFLTLNYYLPTLRRF